MEFQEAIAIAGQLKGHFRAFEKLEQTIQAAIAADKYVSEIQGRITALHDEESQLAEAVGKRKADHETVNARQQERFDVLEQSFRDRRAALESSHDQRATELESVISRRTTEANNVIAQLEQRRDALASQVTQLEQQSKTIKQAHEELKARLG